MARKNGQAVVETTSDLRKLLIDTINKVRSGEMEPRQASTISSLATTVLRSAKLDLDFARFRADDVSQKTVRGEPLTLVTDGGKS